jgi:hypothetical protein
MSSSTACKTMGHAIALSHWNDYIMVAPATYVENLTIRKNLKIIGSGAAKTIVDGNHVNSVFTISNQNARVYLSKLTIRNGGAQNHPQNGGGINNTGTLTLYYATISGNVATGTWGSFGGGIYNGGTLTISKSTISGNYSHTAYNLTLGAGIYNGGALAIHHSTISGNTAFGGRGNGSCVGTGIYNGGTLTISDSTISGNRGEGYGWSGGGGIYNGGTLTISNSTISENGVFSSKDDAYGGGIDNRGTVTINSSTLSGNYAAILPTDYHNGAYGGGIHNQGTAATVQNSIVANFSGNCYGSMSSNGYNLSSDDTCSLSGPGDMNSTDPKLGLLGYHGGHTKTVPIQQGSPAIDAGNPNGCTDNDGNLLKTDQRGFIRPDNEDNAVCDIGSFERQKKKW